MQNIHNTVEAPDKVCTGPSKKNKKGKLKNYKYTLIRIEPHTFFSWNSERHFVKLIDAEKELRKYNDNNTGFGGEYKFELITYAEYLDRMNNDYYKKRGMK